MVPCNKKCKATWFAVVLSLCALMCLPLANAASPWASIGTQSKPSWNAPFLAYLAATHPITVVVGLKVRNSKQLFSTAKSLMTPASKNYGHWLTHQQVMQRFAPTVADANSVAAYLKSKGFTDVTISPSRMLVIANGTAASVLAAFNTRMAYFQRNSRVAYANTDAISLPANLTGVVSAVLGLQDMYRVHTDQEVAVHSTTDFPTIYDAAPLGAASSATVGIIAYGDISQTENYDFPLFENYYHIAIPVEYVKVGIGSTPIGGDLNTPNEWDIDSQTILGMAGMSLKELIFYDAIDCDTPAGTGGSSTCVDAGLTEAYVAAVNADAARVINISLGICESAAHADLSMSFDDQEFAAGVAQGQTFVASSGDDGAYCNTGTGTSSSPEVEYPASSPYVIAVGGTTLYTTNGNTYSSEVGWSGSGGGQSGYESMPSWQKGIVPGNMRGVPDVAFDADPQSGEAIAYGYIQVSQCASPCTPLWADEGGTSLAAPILVGGWARVESAASRPGGVSSLYGYYSDYYVSKQLPVSGSFFRDITSGSNGYYSAGSGWDYVTGLGSLDFNKLAIASAIQQHRGCPCRGCCNAVTSGGP